MASPETADAWRFVKQLKEKVDLQGAYGNNVMLGLVLDLYGFVKDLYRFRMGSDELVLNL
jgi:hypothetical protein